MGLGFVSIHLVYVFVEAFNPLTLKVIADIYVISILPFVNCSRFVFTDLFSYLPLLFSSLII